jgi:hypothetical protein
LERALEINPAFTPALYVLGFTLADQGRFGWEKDRAASCEAALDWPLAADPGCGEAQRPSKFQMTATAAISIMHVMMRRPMRFTVNKHRSGTPTQMTSML